VRVKYMCIAGLAVQAVQIADRMRREAASGPRHMAQVWHNIGMARTRVSTTVDEQLLKSARQALAPLADAAVLDQALAALLDRHRAAEIDAAYATYDEHPLDEADEWGDLASFREAAAAS
jgi:hypothetical protein